MANLDDLIVSLSFPDDPQISPDGRWVAYAVTPYGREGDHPEGEVWLAAVDGSRSPRRFTSGAGCDQRPRWSPDGRSLAFLSDRRERGVQALYQVPVDGGEARCLVQRKKGISAFAWSPGGRHIAFTAQDDPTPEDERRQRERDDPKVYGERWPYDRLHVLDLDTGETRSLVAEAVHVIDLAWSPDGRYLAYVTSPTPELEARWQSTFWVRDLGQESPRRLTPDRVAFGSDLVWSASGTLLFQGWHEPAPQSAATICALDLADGGPRAIAPAIDEEACGMAVQTVPGDRRVAIAIAQGLSTRLELLDPESGERAPLYTPPHGDIAAFALRVVAGEPVLAAVRHAGDAPPEIHAGPPASLRQLTDHHALLREFRFGAQEPFHWTAPDGVALDGILIRPPDAPAGPLPTVVLVHGGPYGRYGDGWNFRPLNWAQWLATHGYAVLMPNYRGGSGHGNAFATAARGNVGEGDFPDILSAVDAAVERGIADPERLGIGGWSQGGFMTAWAVTQTHRFKAAVMGAGVSDWGMMTLTSDMPLFEAALGGDNPWDGPGPHRADHISPISYAAHARTPLLILHGENDERVPVSQAIGFERALRGRGLPVQLVVYPREPHGVRERRHQLDILQRVRAWYDRWLEPASRS